MYMYTCSRFTYNSDVIFKNDIGTLGVHIAIKYLIFFCLFFVVCLHDSVVYLFSHVLLEFLLPI